MIAAQRPTGFLAIALGFVVSCALCFANTYVGPRGSWPESWPQELEALRKKSSTIVPGAPCLQTAYEIRFETSDEFDAAWPHILSLKSKGAPIILQQGPAQFERLPEPKVNAGVIILCPPCCGPLLPDGTMLPLGPPWPESIKSPSGELPEYVTATDGAWTAYTEQTNSFPSLKWRARIDIVLVIDGHIVDTNRITFPKDSPLIAGHFPQ
jgi:hypothetical protein